MVEGMTAFITGASRGIGREIATTFADAGANVALAARSDGITDTAEAIDAPERTLTVRTDVTDEESVASSIAETVETFGGLDCLVNNAGIAGPTAPIEDVSIEECFQTMDVNVVGMVRTAKHSVSELRASDRGRIINISSISGKRPLRDRTPYVSSKMAVIGLTRTLAVELGNDNVTVNAICPGATAGPRIDSVIEKQAERRGISYETAKAQVFTDETILGTLVEATDTAELALFLASESGKHITAQDINVSGGTVWY